MELLPGLLALQLAATGAGFALLWRRQQRLSSEIVRLKQEAETRGARRSRRAAPGGAVAVALEDAPRAPASPTARAAQAWKLAEGVQPVGPPLVSADTARGLTLALMATLPAFGLFFGVSDSALAAVGLCVSAAMMVIALRPAWRAAAWAGVITAAVWAMIGFLRGAVPAEPLSYCACAAIAAAAGLGYAHERETLPGAAMALVTGAATLALAGQTEMIGPAGAAFATIMAAAAVVGAINLRLESIHLGAFVSSLIGLFVLSGQEAAAVWFTPAAAWTGALFFAIAFVRTPQLGPRGATLAGTGSLAPFLAIAALHGAQHGLANVQAAAGAFLLLATLLGALIALSALRRPAGLAALRLTHWILSFGAFASLTAATALAAPAPLAAAIFGALGVSLLALNLGFPSAAWRVFACAATLLAILFGLTSAELFLLEASAWPPYTLLLVGIMAPALLSGAGVAIAARAQAQSTAGLFEAAAIILGVAFANLATRLFFTGGATVLQPITLPEAGAHAAIWLAAALVIASRPPRAERRVRPIAIHGLTFMGLGAIAIASAQWSAAFATAEPPFNNDALGFLLPGLLLWAHWVFWRGRGVDLHTRISLGAGALLLAAALTLHVVRTDSASDWIKALVGALSFALAIGMNFAPGVTATETTPASDFEKNLYRHRRRKQRIQSR